MKDKLYYDQQIMNKIIERNNDCVYYTLTEHSSEYQKSKSENDKIAKKFPCINEILENSFLQNRDYNFDEISALATYCKNRNRLEDLERFEIYLYGLMDKQKLSDLKQAINE